jgi:hypothetical protein
MKGLLRPKRRWNDEGVASTVGTIMALLVFLTFLSLIVNQWVPVWMKDSEAAHMNVALGQFGEFKGDVDLQILAAQMAQIAQRHYVPMTAYSPVTLGIDGVPIFASPTPGELLARPSLSTWNVTFTYDVAGTNRTVLESGGGVVSLEVFNRFFVRQTIAYDNGGVLRVQFDGQIVRAEPSFEVLIGNDTVEYGFVLVSLFGTGGVAGTGTEGIRSKLISVDFQDYGNVLTSVWINATTPYGHAWYRQFNATLSQAWSVSDDDITYTPSTKDGKVQETVSTPFYRISATWDTARQTYVFSMELKNDYVDDGNPDDGLRLGAFRLLHAYVNVAIGEKGGDVEV